jgi:hypothetical protein
VKVLGLVFLLAYSSLALGQVPQNALKFAPLLKETLIKIWPTVSPRSYFAGQVEQETCVSLKSKKCWSPSAELRTSREYGFGLGQLTVTSRFNAFNDVKKLDKDLAAWKWENRYDPTYQLRALVVYDRSIYTKLPVSIEDKMPFTFASYNGGLGGILQDRRLCENTKGCNHNLWFGNVELTSFKSKIKPQGYAKSFFEINREYPRNIISVRSKKYSNLMD